MKRLFLIIVMCLACLNIAIASTFVNSPDTVKKELSSAHDILTKKKKRLLGNCVKIIQFISKKRMAEINGDKKTPEYEEYVSIGIIAAQAILKKKTDEELLYFAEWDFAAAIDYAMISELCHRYDFIKNIYKDCKFYSGLLKLLYIKELYEYSLDETNYENIVEELKPYYTIIMKILPIYEEKMKIPLMSFISEPTKYSEWLSYNNIDELDSNASSIVGQLTKNRWGVSNFVIKATIVEGNYLNTKGYQGDFYVLELGDWNINSHESIFITHEKQNRVGYCVLMSNGKIYEETWDKELGFKLNLVKVNKDTVLEIRQKYEQYINTQNGNLMEIFDETKNLREKE